MQLLGLVSWSGLDSIIEVESVIREFAGLDMCDFDLWQAWTIPVSEIAIVSLTAAETKAALHNIISPTHVSHLQSMMGLSSFLLTL